MCIVYTYCKLYSKEAFNFNTDLKLVKNDFKKTRIIWIYTITKKGEPIEKIYNIIFL